MSKRAPGRPFRYANIIEALDPDTVYSPSSISRFANENGLLDFYLEEGVDRALAQQRVRITMRSLSHHRDFPEEGDGPVKVKGQPSYRGWFGWRWQDAIG